jgi:DEAD/DEAH box helicase domain-containing protein
MITEIIFDLETKKLFQDIESSDPVELGISIISLYKRQLDQDFNEIDGKMYSFFQQNFENMWPLFTGVDRVIGFNSLHFDIPIVCSICPFDFKKLTHFDIMEKIKKSLGFRLSLDALARETLGKTKSDIGTNAVLYWNQGTKESLTKLKKYCEMDVLLTRNIYDYGRNHGHLKYKDKWNTPRIVEIDFSYPKTEVAYKQMDLF